MGLDQLLELTSSVSMKILPILGVIAFIFLIVLIKRLLTVVTSANKAVESLTTTLDTTNRQLDTLDKPLHTLNDLSETVDAVHSASKTAVKSAAVAVVENFSTIKDWALSKTQKSSDTTETINRSDEDGTDETTGY